MKPIRRGDPLTDREIQILAVIAEGNSNREAGDALWLAMDTIKNSLHRIYRKLGARDRAHAVHIAHREGILS